MGDEGERRAPVDDVRDGTESVAHDAVTAPVESVAPIDVASGDPDPHAAAEPSPAWSPDPSVRDPLLSSRPAADGVDPEAPVGDMPVGDGSGRSARGTLRMIGGVLAICIVALLAALTYLLANPPGAGRVEGLERQTTDLTNRLAALEQRPAPALDSDLAQRVATTDRTLAALAASVKALEARPAPEPVAASSGDGPARTESLAKDVEALKTQLADVPKVDLGPLTARADAADKRLDELQAKLAAVPVIDLAPIEARIEALQQQLKPIDAEFQAAKSAARVTEARQNGSGAETRAAPLAVAAQAVTRAIEDGRPFPQDIKALQALGADPKVLQPLQAVSDNGAPGLKDLRAELAGLRDRMMAGATPAPSGSYLDRLISGAGTLVQVRPLGTVSGDRPAAILARMDADLASDDPAASLAEWDKLPAAAKDVSRGLADRIRLRAAAADAARTIASQAIGALAASQP